MTSSTLGVRACLYYLTFISLYMCNIVSTILSLDSKPFSFLKVCRINENGNVFLFFLFVVGIVGTLMARLTGCAESGVWSFI
jgi:hypothetical protein